jgi:glycosyltransferase involved in cell wall biosynthesis
LAASLRRLAKSAGLESLEILCSGPDMAALIDPVDLIVLPATRTHGKADISLVVLEAMAAGRPVIVCDLPTAAALGDAVIRIPPGDADALARAIGEVASSGDRRSHRVAAARALVEARFSESSMVRGYVELYGELLAMRVP